MKSWRALILAMVAFMLAGHLQGCEEDEGDTMPVGGGAGDDGHGHDHDHDHNHSHDDNDSHDHDHN
ncbi:unnamed protein product, partial [Symbiodinium sp. CCMP2456]